MIKVSFCLRRLPHLSREAFLDYWLNSHADLMRRHAKTLGVKRYVQVHGMPTAIGEAMQNVRGAPEPYDGTAEVWFETLDDIMANGRDPAAREAARELLDDERTFVDLEKSPIWIGEEHEVIG